MCCYAELNVSGEQKWVLARTTDLTSYRSLERLKEENKAKEDELQKLRSTMKNIIERMHHERETQSQQLKDRLVEKEQLVKQQEVLINTLKQEMDQLKFQIAETTGL